MGLRTRLAKISAVYSRKLVKCSALKRYTPPICRLGQDRFVTKNGLGRLVLILVLHIWCCVVKHGLVMLVIIMILKDTETFQVLFVVSLCCARNITTVKINCGVYFYKN